MNAVSWKCLVLGVAISISACASGVYAQPGITREPAHLQAARWLVANLDLHRTDYEHGHGSVTFTRPCASYTDCSGFVDALLSYSYGYDEDQYREWFGSRRPTARRYHDAIEREDGFACVERIQDVMPGDFLAVKYLHRTDNTGHIMLAASRPRRMSAKAPLVPGTVQWEVAVIDSSKTGHGPTDTRHKKGAHGKDHDGLGHGVLRIYADHRGAIVGHAWSTLKASQFKDPSDEHLVVGRLVVEK